MNSANGEAMPDVAYEDCPGEIPVSPQVGVPMERKMERADLLEIENLYLKAENVRMQIEKQQAEMIKSGQVLNGVKTELMAKQAELSKKYGVNLSAVYIAPDGTITPQAPPAKA